jgi:hypothetical protein
MPARSRCRCSTSDRRLDPAPFTESAARSLCHRLRSPLSSRVIAPIDHKFDLDDWLLHLPISPRSSSACARSRGTGVWPGISGGCTLRIVPSGFEPFGFVGAGVSWFPSGGVPTVPAMAVDCERTGRALTTTADRLMRLSVRNHRHQIVMFIGCLHASRHGRTMPGF